MFITTPTRLLKLLASNRQSKDQEMGTRLRHSQFYLDNRDLWPTYAQYEAAAQFLTNRTGLIWLIGDTMGLLAFYPFVRIELAKHGLSRTRGVDDALANAAANLILHCRWPIYRDRVDMNLFLELLRTQGEKMGLHRLHKSPEAMSPEKRRARFALIPGRPA